MSRFLITMILFVSLGCNLSCYGETATFEGTTTFDYGNACIQVDSTVARYVDDTPTAWIDAAPRSFDLASEDYLVSQYVVDEDNNYYCTVDGVLYSKDMSVLYLYPPMKEGWYFQVPVTVSKIEDCAFQGSYYLRELVIPSSVITMVGADTFYGSSVEIIHFPQSITYFNTYMFDYVPCIKKIIAPKESIVATELCAMKEYIDFSDLLILY